MSEGQVGESVLKADRYSKVIAIFVALGTYLAASALVSDQQFAMIVAAFVAIGVRIYVPYHALKRTPDTVADSVEVLPGNYHYGAVSGALVIGPLFTIPLGMLANDTTIALGAGIGVTVLVYVVLRVVLPK